jgi:hypothetical protein
MKDLMREVPPVAKRLGHDGHHNILCALEDPLYAWTLP